ncbi:hypothetical protein [Flavobacterium sp.]|jgi:putative transposase|uniref:hypothetical protein n=1 Tax=Flavobacterium sp. TaxID=239 RepID=UPI00378359BD
MKKIAILTFFKSGNFGGGEMILKERERLKKMAIIGRRNEYQKLKLTTNQKKHLSLNY